MSTTPPDVRDMGRTRLRLRDDIRISVCSDGSTVNYQLEATASGRFFQIGRREYLLISCLDGTASLAEAITASTKFLLTDAFTESEAFAICHWLMENDLVEIRDSGVRSFGSGEKRKNREAINPFWIKLPVLRHPDKILDHLTSLFGWCLTSPAFVTWTLLLCWAGNIIAGQWEAFAYSGRTLFSSSNWSSLIAVWIALKVIHELAHGVACRRQGGSVRELGIVMVFFAPLAYVDVTSAWAFKDRWKRIQVSLAGMYIELAIAAIAIVAWSRVENPGLRNLCFNVFSMAGISTIVFNANPLMKFDGYYILSDLAGVKNLWQESSQAVSRIIDQQFYGTTGPTTRLAGWKRWFVPVYGMLALIWRIIICSTLLVGSSVIFGGAGIVMTAFGIGVWGLQPIVRTIGHWLRRLRSTPRGSLRAAATTIALAGVASYGLFLMPCPVTTTVPGVVEYAELHVVRASTPGFVSEVFLRDGQSVETGESLLRLENPELDHQILELEFKIKQALAQVRVDRNSGEIGAAQIGEQQVTALRKRLAQKQSQRDGLTLRAAKAGRVSGGPFANLVGRYLAEGSAIAFIGEERNKELQLAVDQETVTDLSHQIGQSAQLRLPGNGRVSGTIQDVEPQAKVQAPHPAFYAPLGGTLAARLQDSDGQSYQFIQPRFKSTILIDKEQAQSIAAGQRGSLHLRTDSKTLGQLLYSKATKWIDAVSNATKDA